MDKQATLEIKSQRRKSAINAIVLEPTSDHSSEKSRGDRRVELLQGIVKAGGIGHLDGGKFDDGNEKVNLASNLQPNGNSMSKRGSVVPRKRELSRVLLSNERLIWKIKIRIEATLPDLSLDFRDHARFWKTQH